MPTEEEIKALVFAAKEIVDDMQWHVYDGNEDFCVGCGKPFECKDNCYKKQLQAALAPFNA